MRSVKLSFTNNNNTKKREQPATRYSTPEQPVRSNNYNNKSNNNNFVETLRVLSNEAKQDQYNDVFDSFFFNDKRCQNRAFFMAARLKTSLDYNPTKAASMRPSSSHGNLPTSSLPSPKPSPSQSTPIVTTSSNDHHHRSPTQHVDSFWRMITHRLYTLNYIMFVLPPDSQLRTDVLNRIEADLSKWGDGQEIYRRGGMETFFAVKYALEKHSHHHKKRKTLLEDAFEAERRMNGDKTASSGVERSVNPEMERLCQQARDIIEQCLESESRLSHQEKDAMYVYHGMRAGLIGIFDVHIELEEDRQLRHLLRDTVRQNQKPPYENPFEDEDCVVREDEDSGFYDHSSV
ncbi:hypothetical protein K501DRAFT_283756 [Backusella circina FSU 941]|nr:hypothetical protein K501DRAFT_283756 [Backusella circina FSU 941]